jgi:hypothetical protein
MTLQDQPVGLLRYVPSIRKCTVVKIGKERDCSYEVSNLEAFDVAAPQNPAGGDQCNIIKMIFSQPATPVSAPMTMGIVSVKGGCMVISIVWQPGAFGIPLESESTFIDGLGTFLKDDLKNLK